MEFHCTACDGSMEFDPQQQEMRCTHCGNTCSPKDCESHGDPAMTVYVCQRCGAELVGMDDYAEECCAFCGGEIAPCGLAEKDVGVREIIPFQVSKDECKGLFVAYAKKIWHLPPGFVDPQLLDGFTGVYVPYYLYSAKVTEASAQYCQTVKLDNSHDEISTFVVDASCAGEYGQGCPVGGSRYMDDDVSVRLLPYRRSRVRRFTPAYLAGFCADTSTVPANRYKGDVRAQIENDLEEELKDELEAELQDELEDEGDERVDAKVNDVCVRARLTRYRKVLMPLWILTWDKGGYVGYAVVNGDTGKVIAELPIGMRSFAKAAVFISLVTFILLEIPFQPTPVITSLVSMATALGMALGVRANAKSMHDAEVRAHEGGQKDHGMDERDATGRIRFSEGWRERELRESMSANRDSLFMGIMLVGIPLGFVLLSQNNAEVLRHIAAYDWHSVVVVVAFLVGVVALILSVCMSIEAVSWLRGIRRRLHLVASLSLLVATLINLAVVTISPVNDFWYYLGDAVCIVGAIVSGVTMLRLYNLSTLRPLPQRGGETEVQS